MQIDDFLRIFTKTITKEPLINYIRTMFVEAKKGIKFPNTNAYCW